MLLVVQQLEQRQDRMRKKVVTLIIIAIMIMNIMAVIVMVAMTVVIMALIIDRRAIAVMTTTTTRQGATAMLITIVITMMATKATAIRLWPSPLMLPIAAKGVPVLGLGEPHYRPVATEPVHHVLATVTVRPQLPAWLHWPATRTVHPCVRLATVICTSSQCYTSHTVHQLRCAARCGATATDSPLQTSHQGRWHCLTYTLPRVLHTGLFLLTHLAADRLCLLLQMGAWEALARVYPATQPWPSSIAFGASLGIQRRCLAPSVQRCHCRHRARKAPVATVMKPWV